MSEKINRTLSGVGVSAPNKMRLYATWVDRTPSNCIPRLCTLTLTRLQTLKPLGSDISTISIAVKMQSSKRTLRSNELVLPTNGVLDTLLDVTFCLQYPHFLKRDGNRLHILLQRRKRYKNRTMLGFKTLAEGVIRMDQVLQKPLDLELELVAEGGGKDKLTGPCARLYILQLASNPIDQENKIDREQDFSDDDDEISSGEDEVGDLSDSEPIRTKLPHTRHNFKQRFVSLLRRFRVPESEGGRTADLDNPSDIQALFHELESLSCDEDSGAEQDTVSISSTPKPSLRPFFSSSKSLLDPNTVARIDPDKLGDENIASGSDGNDDLCYIGSEVQNDSVTGSPPRETPAVTKKSLNEGETGTQELTEKKSKLFRSSTSVTKKKNSLSTASEVSIIEVMVRKCFMDQISKLLGQEDNMFPGGVALVSGPENMTSVILNRLSLLLPTIKVFLPTSYVEVKAVLNALYVKMKKYSNSFSKSIIAVKLILVGGDLLVSWFIRSYAEIFSTIPVEWMSYIRLFIVPLGSCAVSKQLAALDMGYMSLFPAEMDVKADELVQRLIRYVSVPSSAPLAQLPLSEVMLTCYDETSQLFVPFMNEVRVGPAEQSTSVSVDLDDCSNPHATSITPPSSPNIQNRETPWEPLELQIDYWQTSKHSENTVKTEKDKLKQDGKVSMKGVFRGLQASPSSSCGLCLNIHMANKEKKQKIMRLGKKKEKDKDIEPRCHNIEGISRLICSARASHATPMKVYIDEVEYSGVKFFQISSGWQTHIKCLTVSLVGVPLASTE